VRRRISQQQPTTIQAFIDHKQATLNAIVAMIPEKSTFSEIADLLGCSHEWVRVRLVKNPECLFRIGNRYLVPKGVAEEFIRSVLS